MNRCYGSRWGRFEISGQFMADLTALAAEEKWDRLEAVLGFMAKVLIVRAQDSADGGTIEYLGVSRYFEELAEGDAIPDYNVEFQLVRTCNACQGTDWGPNDAMEATEVICQGCGAPPEASTFVDHFKCVKRWRPKAVLTVPSGVTDEQIADLKRKWNTMLVEQGLKDGWRE